jgi:hypothetical protein
MREREHSSIQGFESKKSSRPVHYNIMGDDRKEDLFLVSTMSKNMKQKTTYSIHYDIQGKEKGTSYFY